MVSRPGELHSHVVEEMCRLAREVQRHAYAPASHFRVGAAVLADDGRIFTGCNVENASYGLTVCAERNAVGAAVAAGVRALRACVVVTDLMDPARPCGACRQVLAEFGPTMTVVMFGAGNVPIETNLERLLPDPFRFSQQP